MKKLLIPVLITVLLSCQKENFVDNTYASYKLVRDWYTMDTTFVNRAVLWKDDSISRPEIKAKIEAENDMWLIMCETTINPRHLEHWYYLRNGIKIHKNNYPKF